MKRHSSVIRWLMALTVGFVVAFGLFSAPTKTHAAEKTYQIGMDVTFPPFEFANDNNKYVGIDIDLFNAIAKDQHFKINWKAASFSGLIQSVQAGQLNGMVAGMSVTPERKGSFDFSDPYYNSGVVMAVSQNSDNIKGLKDLRGKTVAVKTGTTGAQYAQSIQKKYGFKISTFDDSSNVYEDVLTGNSAACFDDEPVLKYGINQGTKLKIVTKPAAGTPVAFGVKKGTNQELLKKFNAGLAHLKKNGEYKKIIDRYLNAKKNAADTHSFIGILKQNKTFLWEGFLQTLWLTIVSIFFATIFGVIFGLFGVLPIKFFRWLSSTVIYLFRGMPLLVLALFIYTGIPTLTGTRIPAFVAGVITLMLDEGAYIAAFVKGGIESVDKGQMEAARSLGLPFGKSMRKVILPQGVKLMVPSFINQFIITLKDTSILSIIGILELTQTGKIIIARNLEGFKVWAMVAIIYLIVITLLTWLSNWVKRRAKI
ncbi:Glutamine-binding protein / glutamine transport system permease protein [Apilactobacillus kunkeei]|uniref:Glutamine-binding protein / glutamine transport system permease protein n=1 Tax=Apilactobacillus kunkeei TaxID=148814 RepID=A0A0M9DC74_9LACO|nr:Glutamine-binding protein / glutamine transport system permease protein [Apilactobacillus kunkeei]